MKAILCCSGRTACIPIHDLPVALLPICNAPFVVRPLQFPGHAPPLIESFQ